MANISTSTQRKCKGFRREPQFGLWLWCIVIILISLPCVFSKCQGVDISVSVYPEGMIKLLYGTPLEIFCVTEKHTSDNLEFYLGGKLIESEKVNVTTRRLYIEYLEKQVYTFYCRNTVTNKRCTSRVLVGLPPSNVTDFECISKNLDELNCTWTSPEAYIATKYLLTFFLIDGTKVEACIPNRSGELKWCSWNKSSRPKYKQMEDYYYFHLTAENYFGNNTQNFTIKHFSVVKPDPPEQLKVMSNDTHSVMLQWKFPNNIYDFLPCPIEHRIEYQIAKIANSHFRRVDASNLPPMNKTYNFLLSNLPYAHMSYEVRIYIKPELATEDKYWSDFAYVLFTTASEKSLQPPDTITGVYNLSIYDNKIVLYLYRKQLEEYENREDLEGST